MRLRGAGITRQNTRTMSAPRKGFRLRQCLSAGQRIIGNLLGAAGSIWEVLGIIKRRVGALRNSSLLTKIPLFGSVISASDQRERVLANARVRSRTGRRTKFFNQKSDFGATIFQSGTDPVGRGLGAAPRRPGANAPRLAYTYFLRSLSPGSQS